MKNKIFEIYVRLKDCFFNPDEAWKSVEKEDGVNYFTEMVLPLFPIVVLAMIVGQLIFAEFNFEKLTVGVLVLLLSYGMGFPLSKRLFAVSFRHAFPGVSLPDKTTEAVVVTAV